MASTIDTRSLREAFGNFATGVTIVSYVDTDNQSRGLTVNSFSSVSLNPPMVLWSLQKDSDCFDDIMRAECYAINVLTAGQRALSEHLARKEMHLLDGLQEPSAWKQGKHCPVICDALACFECAVRHRYEGGDHIIIVGEVLHYTRGTGEPLLFYSGAYARIRADGK